MFAGGAGRSSKADRENAALTRAELRAKLTRMREGVRQWLARRKK
jgi:hypothetical protein